VPAAGLEGRRVTLRADLRRLLHPGDGWKANAPTVAVPSESRLRSAIK
jgi:hypothetical protein